MTFSTTPWTWLRRPAGVLVIALAGLGACSGDDPRGDGGATSSSSVTPTTSTDVATPANEGARPMLVRTRVRGFSGRVLAGSVIGQSPFCSGGRVRHERGSPDIGYPAVNVFLCDEGELRVGFGPGPDQMDDAVQTSEWVVLEGSGRYEGTTGGGQMVVQFPEAGASVGEETFMGRVVLP